MGKIRTRESFWDDTEDEFGLLELPGFFRSGLGVIVEGNSYVRGFCDALEGPSSKPRVIQNVQEGFENLAYGALGFAGGIDAKQMLNAYIKGYERGVGYYGPEIDL